jgi:hypothetical protein
MAESSGAATVLPKAAHRSNGRLSTILHGFSTTEAVVQVVWTTNNKTRINIE